MHNGTARIHEAPCSRAHNIRIQQTHPTTCCQPEPKVLPACNRHTAPVRLHSSCSSAISCHFQVVMHNRVRPIQTHLHHLDAVQHGLALLVLLHILHVLRNQVGGAAHTAHSQENVVVQEVWGRGGQVGRQAEGQSSSRVGPKESWQAAQNPACCQATQQRGANSLPNDAAQKVAGLEPLAPEAYPLLPTLLWRPFTIILLNRFATSRCWCRCNCSHSWYTEPSAPPALCCPLASSLSGSHVLACPSPLTCCEALDLLGECGTEEHGLALAGGGHVLALNNAPFGGGAGVLSGKAACATCEAL